MPKWILIYEDKVMQFDDMTFCNQQLYKEQPLSILFLYDSNTIFVNLITGDIIVNNKLVKNKNKPNNIRWINFRTVEHTISGSRILATKITYKLGWQDTINGKNVKKIIEVDNEGIRINRN